MSMPRKLLCTCSSCEGGKYISRATWYRHRLGRLQEINELDIGTPEAGPSQMHGRARPASAQDGFLHAQPPSKHRRLGEPAADQDNELEVRTILSDLSQQSLLRNTQYLDIQAVNPMASLQTGTSHSVHDTDADNSPGDSEQQDLQDLLLDAPDPGSIADTFSGDLAVQVPPAPLEDQLDADAAPTEPASHIEDIRIAQEFIELLKHATLDESGLHADALARLRNPPQQPLQIDDPDILLSLEIYLAISNASQETYDHVRSAILRRHPETKILSYYQVKKMIAELSGVDAVSNDMCVNSCLAFTGPFAKLEICPTCAEPRYDQAKLASSGGKLKIPRQQFSSMPLGPQLQAQYRSAEGATAMRYLDERVQAAMAEAEQNGGVLESFEDVCHSSQLLNAYKAGTIKPNDIVLGLSMDGAQLYRSKQSDTWIYIWVIYNLAPNSRYKKKFILPGGVIPGPNNLKNLDSFLFTGLYHLAALQREGLRIWDASVNTLFTSNPFLAMATADGPAMAYMNGLVGHHGAYGCRLYCPLKGRHKPGCPHYYPALLKPDDYTVQGCDHDDVNLSHLASASVPEYKRNLAYVQSSPNETQYKMQCKDTGISKPSIFSGLPRAFDVPGCFPIDLMHLVALNITDLLLGLYRGVLEGSKPDDKEDWDWEILQGELWRTHGEDVASTTPYLPGSFDRPPRNIAEKITSGYKAWEFLLYLLGLAPALLRHHLPENYWQHLCKLVCGIRILHQCKISHKELVQAHGLLTQYIQEFETLYYRCNPDRLHFIRPCLHTLWHLAQEVVRMGPPVYYTQWTMERTIGNLGEEIKQPSNPYANLSQRAVRRCQINLLKAAVPLLQDPEAHLPRGAFDLGNGSALLRGMDTAARHIPAVEAMAFYEYLATCKKPCNTLPHLYHPMIRKWARFLLPNGQVVRSLWKEELKPKEKVRMSRNVKLLIDNQTEIAEVYYFCRFQVGDEFHAVALVSVYSRLNAIILAKSFGTVWLAQNRGTTELCVVNVNSIQSVVAMPPDRPPDGAELMEGMHYLVEKPGLDVICLGSGTVEAITDE
ncbi:hypothetical protein A0H81_13935 [Grifola frondosa]|uniref:Transposase family Tnp2 protein n=1 Tax=Grifola frondosa TaxID=5627 RepID=A0A1C7LPB4_GRIFR|nr:hypothetical protein A0H81_13935 [Grifola frondosa]